MTATYLGSDLTAVGWGLSLYGELYYRDTHETDTMAVQSTESFGGLAQAGLFPFWFARRTVPYLADRLEIVFRYQDFAPSTCTGFMETSQSCAVRLPSQQSSDQYQNFMHTAAYTFGLNWYQFGHGFKIQSDFTIYNYLSPIAGMGPGSGIVGNGINDVFITQLTGSF